MNTKDLHPGLGSGALREALERDARRYWRVRVLGAALCESRELREGNVLGFTNLDAAVDDDIRINPSRGEAELGAALALSSPIEPIDASAIALEFLATCSKISLPTGNIPAPTTEEVRKLVSSLARPTPQASSEIREARVAAFNEAIDAINGVRFAFERSGWADALERVIKLRNAALAPSRQGAGGK